MDKCRKCGSESLSKREADRRAFCVCRGCGEFTYEPRRVTGGYEEILDRIAEGVAERGHYEMHGVVLINTVFRAEPDLDSHSQIKAWAAKHLLRFWDRGEMAVFERDGVALARLMRGE